MSDPQSDLPLYKAHGYVTGVLERSESSAYLVQPDGHRLRVDTIRPDLKSRLENASLDENPRIWSVYPRTKRDGTVSSLMLCALPAVPVPLVFTVSGQVIYCGESLIAVSIRRNQKPPVGKERSRSWQPTVITLNGSLAELRCWQYWRLQCELKDGRLVIVDGIKVADAPPRPTKAQPVLSSPEELPPAAAPPLRPKQTFDLSRR